jgi:hypothetical protein
LFMYRYFEIFLNFLSGRLIETLLAAACLIAQTCAFLSLEENFVLFTIWTTGTDTRPSLK